MGVDKLWAVEDCLQQLAQSPSVWHSVQQTLVPSMPEGYGYLSCLASRPRCSRPLPLFTGANPW